MGRALQGAEPPSLGAASAQPSSLGPTRDPARDLCERGSQHYARSMRKRRDSRLGLGLWFFGSLSACGGATEPVSTVAPQQPTAVADAGAAASKLPPGVLAEGVGLAGLVRVEERDGLRLLTIGGVVQGARRVAEASAAVDPIVELLARVRPEAKSALLVGLGTGNTARAMLEKWPALEVMEREPLVIAYAREFFGYTGPADEYDALRGLVNDARAPQEVVVLDASLDGGPESELVAAAIGAGKKLGESAVLALRVSASPEHPSLAALRLALPRHQLWFQSGVGSEKQTIYLLAAKRPMNLAPAPELGLWPMDLESARWSDIGASTRDTRTIDVTGYLVRLEGQLYLDVPHYEMGARRYVLRGDRTDELERALGKASEFPTSGDIGSDGDTKRTLAAMLGGGGAKRNEVRFSPVSVRLRGEAKLLAVVDPDAAPKVPAELRGSQPTDPHLPYGGVLYELVVRESDAPLHFEEWSKLSPSLRAKQDSAVAQAKKGEAARAIQSLEDSVKLFDSMPVVRGRPLPARELASSLGAAIRGGIERTSSMGHTDTDPARTPWLCLYSADMLDGAPRVFVEDAFELRERLRAAFVECALRTLRPERAAELGSDARVLALRRIELLERSGRATAAQRAEAGALRKRYGL
jgi:hypothetical protein